MLGPAKIRINTAPAEKAILIIVFISAIFLRVDAIRYNPLSHDDVAAFYKALPDYDKVIAKQPHRFHGLGLHLPGRELYFYLVDTCIYFFGNHDISLRIMPLLSSFLFMLIYYFFTKRVFNKEIAILALSFFAISRGAIGNSVSPRPESFLLLFTFLSTFLFWEIINGRNALVLYALVALFAII